MLSTVQWVEMKERFRSFEYACCTDAHKSYEISEALLEVGLLQFLLLRT